MPVTPTASTYLARAPEPLRRDFGSGLGGERLGRRSRLGVGDAPPQPGIPLNLNVLTQHE